MIAKANIHKYHIWKTYSIHAIWKYVCKGLHFSQSPDLEDFLNIETKPCTEWLTFSTNITSERLLTLMKWENVFSKANISTNVTSETLVFPKCHYHMRCTVTILVTGYILVWSNTGCDQTIFWSHPVLFHTKT